ncbi:transcriptional regulator [Paenibacillus vini]|uniref:Transcriptional regulator n=2 Tax=Paenibacillus vini TaxID=1476024 RepID=A0ABQ4MFN0_9BACL|nr:transcriptional regulator [Paenibacillus vini]
MQFSHNLNLAWVNKMYKRIRDLREDRDLTQQQLADRLNISQATYSRYESGNLDVPSSVLIRLSEFYNVSIDYILGQTDISKRLNGMRK